jgi:ABC-type nitrate/sulfonate/bicarbonate transport system permease component
MSDPDPDASAWPRRAATAMIVPATLLVTWQLLALVIGDYAIASPAATVHWIGLGFERGWLVAGLAVTLRSALYAAAIAGSAGVVCGFLLGRNPFWYAVLEEPAVWIYSVPKVALYPILVLALGLGARSNIGFGVLQGAFPPLLIIAAAVASLPPSYVKLARMQRLSHWRFFSRIALPYALPSIAVGLRYCFSLSYIGVVVAEMFAAESGIGFELIKAISQSQIPKMFAIVTVITLIAGLVNLLFLQVERWLTPAGPQPGGS